MVVVIHWCSCFWCCWLFGCLIVVPGCVVYVFVVFFVCGFGWLLVSWFTCSLRPLCICVCACWLGCVWVDFLGVFDCGFVSPLLCFGLMVYLAGVVFCCCIRLLV